jgi:hypothetical protein
MENKELVSAIAPNVQLRAIFTVSILLPLVWTYSLWAHSYGSQIEYLSTLAYWGTCLAFIYLAVPWSFANYYCRYAIPVVFSLAAAITYMRVLLAHMHNGSVLANVGERLRLGQPLGKVENSGNTSEPHLHVHAKRSGLGIPILFEEKFLVRNSLVLF